MGLLGILLHSTRTAATSWHLVLSPATPGASPHPRQYFSSVKAELQADRAPCTSTMSHGLLCWHSFVHIIISRMFIVPLSGWTLFILQDLAHMFLTLSSQGHISFITSISLHCNCCLYAAFASTRLWSLYNALHSTYSRATPFRRQGEWRDSDNAEVGVGRLWEWKSN